MEFPKRSSPCCSRTLSFPFHLSFLGIPCFFPLPGMPCFFERFFPSFPGILGFGRDKKSLFF